MVSQLIITHNSIAVSSINPQSKSTLSSVNKFRCNHEFYSFTLAFLVVVCVWLHIPTSDLPILTCQFSNETNVIKIKDPHNIVYEKVCNWKQKALPQKLCTHCSVLVPQSVFKWLNYTRVNFPALSKFHVNRGKSSNMNSEFFFTSSVFVSTGCILGTGPNLWEVSSWLLQSWPGETETHDSILKTSASVENAKRTFRLQ